MVRSAGAPSGPWEDSNSLTALLHFTLVFDADDALLHTATCVAGWRDDDDANRNKRGCSRNTEFGFLRHAAHVGPHSHVGKFCVCLRLGTRFDLCRLLWCCASHTCLRGVVSLRQKCSATCTSQSICPMRGENLMQSLFSERCLPVGSCRLATEFRIFVRRPTSTVATFVELVASMCESPVRSLSPRP